MEKTTPKKEISGNVCRQVIRTLDDVRLILPSGLSARRKVTSAIRDLRSMLRRTDMDALLLQDGAGV
jgi:hypothetical protein